MAARARADANVSTSAPAPVDGDAQHRRAVEDVVALLDDGLEDRRRVGGDRDIAQVSWNKARLSRAWRWERSTWRRNPLDQVAGDGGDGQERN